MHPNQSTRIEPERTELTVVTYNVHSCVGTDGRYSLERIAQLIQGEHPDLVCLQEIEVNRQHPPHQTRSWSAIHCDDQPTRIAQALGFEYVAFAPAIASTVVVNNNNKNKNNKNTTAGGIPSYCSSSLSSSLTFSPSYTTELHQVPGTEEDGNPGGLFGICIVSRYPILQQHIVVYTPYGTKTRRNALACLIALPNHHGSSDGTTTTTTTTAVWIVNTHLGCHTGGEQYHQAIELVTFIQSLSTKRVEEDTISSGNSVTIAGIILCGDLNSLPFFHSIKTIEDDAGMHDAWKEAAGGGGSTGVGMFGSFAGCTFPAPDGILPSTRFLDTVGYCCTNRIPPLMRLDYMFTKSFQSHTIRTHCIRVVNKSRLHALTTAAAVDTTNSKATNNDRNNVDDDDDDDGDPKLVIDIKASDHLAVSAIFSIETIIT